MKKLLPEEKKLDFDCLQELLELKEEQDIRFNHASKIHKANIVFLLAFIVMFVLSCLLPMPFFWAAIIISAVMLVITFKQYKSSKFNFELEYGMKYVADYMVNDTKTSLYN